MDWWALGILIFEMLAGFPPFFDDNVIQIYQKIVQGQFDFPDHFETLVRDLISGLLKNDLTLRLGCLKGSTSDVMQHAWFGNVKVCCLWTLVAVVVQGKQRINRG